MKNDSLMLVEKPSTRTPASIPATTIFRFRWNMWMPADSAGRSSQSGGVMASSKRAWTSEGASGSSVPSGALM